MNNFEQYKIECSDYIECRLAKQRVAKALMLLLETSSMSEEEIMKELGIDHDDLIHITETDIHETIPSL